MSPVLLLIWDQIQDFQTLYMEKYPPPSTPTIYWKISKKQLKMRKKYTKNFHLNFQLSSSTKWLTKSTPYEEEAYFDL